MVGWASRPSKKGGRDAHPTNLCKLFNSHSLVQQVTAFYGSLKSHRRQNIISQLFRCRVLSVNLTPMGIAVSLPALRSRVRVIISASLVVLN